MDISTESLHSLMPLGATLGIELVSADRDAAVGRLPWAEHLTTAGGALHGGTLMALADTVGGVVAFLNLPEGAGTSTISSSTVFVRGVRDGQVTATGRLVHRGRSTIVVETELTDDAGRTLTRTTQTQAVLLR
jgi:uncharacterized protein (TIGR00369 family)